MRVCVCVTSLKLVKKNYEISFKTSENHFISVFFLICKLRIIVSVFLYLKV